MTSPAFANAVERGAFDGMHGPKRLPLDENDIAQAYVVHGSVWKAGKALGVSGQTVQRHLAVSGVSRKNNRISQDELDAIREHYARGNVNLSELASQLGRSKHLICRKAKMLGLTEPRHRLDPATRHIPVRPSEKWKKFPHPRGALGLKHSEETKAKISLLSRRSWATAKAFGVGSMSDEARQRRSDAMSKWRATQPAENAYSRAKAGRRDDIGPMYFRSAWEANYARYLNWLQARGEIDQWEYEPATFWFEAIKRGVRSYKPDFRIREKGRVYFVEVKGWMDPKSKTKIRRMKKYHPTVELRVVGARQYASIKSVVSHLIKGWE